NTVRSEHAAWIHHGATSQDIVDTALALVARDATVRIEQELTGLAGSLAQLAAQQRDTPTVARTLTQQALPTTVGMRAATWLAGVHDALRAIRDDGLLPVSLAGPGGTGSSHRDAAPGGVAVLAAGLGRPTPASPW